MTTLSKSNSRSRNNTVLQRMIRLSNSHTDCPNTMPWTAVIPTATCAATHAKHTKTNSQHRKNVCSKTLTHPTIAKATVPKLRLTTKHDFATIYTWAYSLMVKQSTHNRLSLSSILSRPTIISIG